MDIPFLFLFICLPKLNFATDCKKNANKLLNMIYFDFKK